MDIKNSLQIKIRYNSIDCMNLYTFEPSIEWFDETWLRVMYIYI